MSESVNRKTYALFANPASRKIISELEKSNNEVRTFPPVEIEKIDLDDENFAKLKNLENYDWLILQDVLAVDYFLELLQENSIDIFELDYVRICAVGESVADRLRFSSVHSDIITKTIEPEEILAAMIDYIGEPEFEKLNFLFPKSTSIEKLTESLKTKNATVSELPVYRVKDFNKLEITKLKILLKGGAIDEFIFASLIDFIALKHYFKNEKLSDVLSEIKLSAIGGAVLECAKENNISRVSVFQPKLIN